MADSPVFFSSGFDTGPAVITNPHVVYFDVDETLILWGQATPTEGKRVVVKCTPGNDVQVIKNMSMVRRVEQHHAQGHYIVVHSKAGSEWAAAVVAALEIGHMVNQVIGKPFVMYDDLEPNQWTVVVKP